MIAKRRSIAAVLAVSAALAHTAVGQGTLHVTLRSDPKTFDPLQVTDESSGTIRYLTNDSLVRLDHKTLQHRPELAESWKVSADGRRIAFKLRSGVRFSDGSPFTAEDAAFSLRKVLSSTEPVPAGDGLRPESGGVTVTTNGSEVAVQFPATVASLERRFDEIPMLSAKAPAGERVGLGPFEVAEYKAGSRLTLRRNPNYWKHDAQGRALPYLDSIQFDIQSNREIEVLRFERGEIDSVVSLDVDAHDKLGVAHGAIDAGETFDSEMLWFNQVSTSPIESYKKEWFRSREFRRALSEAINRDDLVKLVYKGRATSAAGPFASAAKPWSNTKLKPHAYDPSAALQRLARAGFHRDNGGSRDNGVLRDATGHNVEFSVITNGGNRARLQMATMIQADWAKLGVTLNVVTLDMPSVVERITKNYRYEACLLGLAGLGLDPNDQMNVWLSSSSTHQWNPKQPKPETAWEAEIDRLMNAQSSTADPAKRKTLLDRFQQIVWDETPMIYLVHPHALVAVSPSIENAKPTVMLPRVLWNAEELRLRPTASKTVASGF